jgi:hypothetical protein
MATIEAEQRRRMPVLLGLAGMVVAGVLVAIWSLRPPPQMGPSREVFDTVDALFTAVTAHDEPRMSQCQERLRGYREAGVLPGDAAYALDAIIERARSGSWQPAAKQLYAFMNGQKREGVRESVDKRKKRTPAPPGKR